jgi:hypothetical protein
MHSNESTNQMQQLITGLLLVVEIQLNMFRASSCPSSGAYQLQQQPLDYRRNVVVAVLLPPRSYGRTETLGEKDPNFCVDDDRFLSHPYQFIFH